MIKPIQLTDAINGKTHTVEFTGNPDRPVAVINGIHIRQSDMFAIAQQMLYGGPITPERETFIRDIAESTHGDGPYGPSYRPSVARQLSGTRSGM